MPITFNIPPREPEPEKVNRCPICGDPYGPDGVPKCNFLSGREVVTVRGGTE